MTTRATVVFLRRFGLGRTTSTVSHPFNPSAISATSLPVAGELMIWCLMWSAAFVTAALTASSSAACRMASAFSSSS
eukprot:45779-Eustigmatos_ZCMA.PRE.1